MHIFTVANKSTALNPIFASPLNWWALRGQGFTLELFIIVAHILRRLSIKLWQQLQNAPVSSSFASSRMPEPDVELMTYGESNQLLGDPGTGSARSVSVQTPHQRHYAYPSNAVSNAKYNPITFIPRILYEQFKFFFNLYFLLVALSQAWPPLRIGYLSSYVVPLAFVLGVTISKEAWDDILRRRRDNEANAESYELANTGMRVPAKQLRVGDVVVLYTNQRVPADLVVLRSSEHNGETFIRTDQLDGETDWKLRSACQLTQNMPRPSLFDEVTVQCNAPEKSISSFQGTLTLENEQRALTVDNTMWANTVVAAGNVEGMIVYTGRETRMALNTSASRSKVSLLELQVNSISKILCACVFVLSVVLVACQGFSQLWYLQILRFLILFSTIIPVSLRVNLDMAKSVYAYQIEHDPSVPETVVRTSTIPEDLGRIEYLLTDKTGTITQNDMDLRRIHVGSVSFGLDSMDDVAEYIAMGLGGNTQGRAGRREVAKRVWNLAHCLSLCHSVTPVEDEDTTKPSYQAVSPDEIAIVAWTQSVGLELVKRDRQSMVIKHTASGELLTYKVLYTFPFNSDSKRMGIVVQNEQDASDLWFFVKGADTAVAPLVMANDWLDEEVGNMAREGLRTLVVARKKLTKSDLETFASEYAQASVLMSADRDAQMARVVSNRLETELELLGVTGVEDKLQPDIKPSLELLRNAGIRIWMLTGDKVETAKCVAVSSRLVSRGQYIYTLTGLDSIYSAQQHLDFLDSMGREACLLIDGSSLLFFQIEMPQEFANVALKLPVVVACRCTPQQKADLTSMVKRETGKRVAAIGDGGNDVSMIQAADIGVGIVGKEGRQASLAADYSITMFCHLTRLLLWHGRNSYKRSAKLAQVVIHRGLVISVCQAVYSICSSFEPLALYQGWLMVGYATVYTMAPVFSLVLDHDIGDRLTRIYPELYAELKDGRSLSYHSFFKWCFVALYQGVLIQGLSQLMLGKSSLQERNFKYLVMVSFTALVFTELLMVAIEITTWNKVMVLCELATLACYVASVPFLGDYFELEKLKNPYCYGVCAAILAGTILPAWIGKLINRRLKPPSYAKVQV